VNRLPTIAVNHLPSSVSPRDPPVRRNTKTVPYGRFMPDGRNGVPVHNRLVKYGIPTYGDLSLK
jgi:hypothetical protein